MIYGVVFLALLVIPVRFFYLNSYFLKVKLANAFETYRGKQDSEKMVDSFLGLLFVIGMGALAAFAT